MKVCMTTDPFPIQRDLTPDAPGVVVVQMVQEGRPVVVLNEDLIRRLEATFKTIPSDARGLILASASPRAFVAGADLKAIQDLSDDDLRRYLEYGSRVFGMLTEMPMPTVAAIHGAALGGGLELAMHCDGIVACPPSPTEEGQPGRPYMLGLPEAGLGICPGWGGTNLLPGWMNSGDAIRRTATGRPMTVEDASKAGLFDAVAPDLRSLLTTAAGWVSSQATPARDGAPSRCISRSPAQAKILAALDAVREELVPASGAGTPAAGAVVEAIDAGLSQGWQAGLSSERESLIRLRHTPEAKAAIEAFFAKSAQK
ncbi:MAG: hypothetical protein EA378_11345 [Phycisphaerales bacterium]|nr:MAG: hypothetical protein EA378_11345 [Phycisphaerales bacterium]